MLKECEIKKLVKACIDALIKEEEGVGRRKSKDLNDGTVKKHVEFRAS